jgi:ABC-type phosphate/phosphonate transport system substrate-binding protein
MDAYRVGAVAYHPRVVSIWEAFRTWFAEQGLRVEHTLYATYEAQVDALVAGQIDVAWNTNLAYVRVRERVGGACAALAMRDNDRNWTSHAVVPAGAATGIDGLRGKRVGFGDSDSPQAYILPVYALRRQGLDVVTDIDVSVLDRDLGKHGDTGGAELEQLARLRRAELDACIVSEPTLAAERAAGRADDLAIAWTTPPFHHCNFTALEGSTAAHDRFASLLLSMDAADPMLCEAMRLEWVNRWVEGDESGYGDLIAAVQDGDGSTSA